MKRPSAPVRILTISFFTVLIVGFVFYRAGAFEKIFDQNISVELSANEFEWPDRYAVDTPVVAMDSIVMEREIMPSSKSMIIPRPKKTDTVKDTSPANTAPNQSPDKPLKKSAIMGSSKSAYIYEPEPAIDTAKKEKK